jgi:class 3 adenylate cyclase
MSASNQASHLAILFADISGSTRLYELLGDAVARLRIADCLRRLEEVVLEHGGKVVKTIGTSRTNIHSRSASHRLKTF